MEKNNEFYKEKYLFYKNKYIDLKNQVKNLGEQKGGLNPKPGKYLIFYNGYGSITKGSSVIIDKLKNTSRHENVKFFKAKKSPYSSTIENFVTFDRFKYYFSEKIFSLFLNPLTPSTPSKLLTRVDLHSVIPQNLDPTNKMLIQEIKEKNKKKNYSKQMLGKENSEFFFGENILENEEYINICLNEFFTILPDELHISLDKININNETNKIESNDTNYDINKTLNNIGNYLNEIYAYKYKLNKKSKKFDFNNQISSVALIEVIDSDKCKLLTNQTLITDLIYNPDKFKPKYFTNTTQDTVSKQYEQLSQNVIDYLYNLIK